MACKVFINILDNWAKSIYVESSTTEKRSIWGVDDVQYLHVQYMTNSTTF